MIRVRCFNQQNLYRDKTGTAVAFPMVTESNGGDQYASAYAIVAWDSGEIAVMGLGELRALESGKDGS